MDNSKSHRLLVYSKSRYIKIQGEVIWYLVEETPYLLGLNINSYILYFFVCEHIKA